MTYIERAQPKFKCAGCPIEPELEIITDMNGGFWFYIISCKCGGLLATSRAKAEQRWNVWLITRRITAG